METETALVRTDRAVELDAIAGVGLNLTLVVNPGDTESKDTVRFNHTLHDLGFFEFRMLIIHILDRFKNLLYCLEIFVLSRILGLEACHNVLCLHTKITTNSTNIIK